jgi:erythritol transport system substrate-binding protein
VAEYFAELMGKQGKYIELTGRSTTTEAYPRSDGFHSVLDKIPDMEMIAQETANWYSIDPFDTVETLLQMYPEVDGIIASYDSMAVGAQAALLAAGRTDVIVVGMDGSDDVIDSIMEGGIDATVLRPVVEMATEAAIQADLYIRTGSTGHPEKQYLDMILLTPENACMYTAFAPNGKSNCP